MKVYIFIQSRYSSTRLPGKALLKINNTPIVEICYKRIEKGFENLMVLTSTECSDDVLEDFFKEKEMNYFRGDLNNVLKRFHDASIQNKIDDDDLVVRLTADNIFPDSGFLSDMIRYFKENGCEYLTSSKPESRLPYGLSAEIFRNKYLKDAYSNAKTNFEKEHVTPWIIENVPVSFFKTDKFNDDLSQLRCTIDTDEDFTSMENLFCDISDMISIDSYELCNKLKDS